VLTDLKDVLEEAKVMDTEKLLVVAIKVLALGQDIPCVLVSRVVRCHYLESYRNGVSSARDFR
jgi:hypothetical protein